jgi:hypothetical protein
VHFSGSTDRIIVVHYQPYGCVRVLDSNNMNRLPFGFPEELKDALPLSDLSLIHPEVVPRTRLPLHLFEHKLDDAWCFFFQQADLAAQQGDWVGVIRLGDQAFSESLWANELSEIYIFIEAYLRTGQYDQAEDLSYQVSESSVGSLNERICVLWQGVELEIMGGVEENYPDFCQ